MSRKRDHSICNWAFSTGRGRFTTDKRKWGANTAENIYLTKEKIASRIPFVNFGYEMHVEEELNEGNVDAVKTALLETQIALAMTTPGLHSKFNEGGAASLIQEEREAARELAKLTVDLTYALKRTWRDDLKPTLVAWNGSYAVPLRDEFMQQEMRDNLVESYAQFARYELSAGDGGLIIATEPKANEGHETMLLQTTGSALAFIAYLHQKHPDLVGKFGVNTEIGHEEMVNLLPEAAYIDQQGMLGNIPHVHVNSQIGNLVAAGAPGQYDIDHGFYPTGAGLAVAGALENLGYEGWLGHDMQPRAGDTEEHAIERVVLSIIAYEACAITAQKEEFSAEALKEATEQNGLFGRQMLLEDRAYAAQTLAREMYQQSLDLRD